MCEIFSKATWQRMQVSLQEQRPQQFDVSFLNNPAVIRIESIPTQTKVHAEYFCRKLLVIKSKCARTQQIWKHKGWILSSYPDPLHIDAFTKGKPFGTTAGVQWLQLDPAQYNSVDVIPSSDRRTNGRIHCSYYGAITQPRPCCYGTNRNELRQDENVRTINTFYAQDCLYSLL